MARKRSEVNGIRGENLRKVLQYYGMDQKELAEKIGYTKEHISYIVNGRRNLTQEAAERIVSLFPNVNLNWLMGYGGYMNWEEEVNSVSNEIGKSFDATAKFRVCLKDFFEYLGYKIEIKCSIFDEKSGYFDHYGEDDSPCYIVSPDGKREEVTYKELQQIIYNIVSFAKHELSQPFDIMWKALR